MSPRPTTSIEVPRWRKYVPGPERKYNEGEGGIVNRHHRQVARRYRARSLPLPSARASSSTSASTAERRRKSLKSSIPLPFAEEGGNGEVESKVNDMENENDGIGEDTGYDEEMEEMEEMLECHQLAIEERKSWAGISDKEMLHLPPRKVPRVTPFSSPSSVALNTNNNSNSNPNPNPNLAHQHAIITPLYPLPYDTFNSLCLAAAEIIAEEQIDSQSSTVSSIRAQARRTVSSVLRAYSTISELEDAVKRTVSVMRTVAINVRNAGALGNRYETTPNRRGFTSKQLNTASNSKDAFSPFSTSPSLPTSTFPPAPIAASSSPTSPLASFPPPLSNSKSSSGHGSACGPNASGNASGPTSTCSLSALELIPSKLLPFVDQCLASVADMSVGCQKFNGSLIEPSLQALAECGFAVESEQKDFKEMCNLLGDILKNQLCEPDKAKIEKAPLHERFSKAFKKNLNSKAYPAFSDSDFNWKDYNFAGSNKSLLDFIKKLAAKAESNNHVAGGRAGNTKPMQHKTEIELEKTQNRKKERVSSLSNMNEDNDDHVDVSRIPSNNRMNGHVNGIANSRPYLYSPPSSSIWPLALPSRSSRSHSRRRLYRPRSPSPTENFIESPALASSSHFNRPRPSRSSLNLFESGLDLQSTRDIYALRPSFCGPPGGLSSHTASSPSHSCSPSPSCSRSQSCSRSRSRSRSGSNSGSRSGSRSPSPSRSLSHSRSHSPPMFHQSERSHQPSPSVYYSSRVLPRVHSPIPSPRYSSHPSVLSNAVTTSRTQYTDDLRSPRGASRPNLLRSSSSLEPSASLSYARRPRSDYRSSYLIGGSSVRLREQSDREILQSRLHESHRNVRPPSRFQTMNPYGRPYRSKDTPVVELDD